MSITFTYTLNDLQDVAIDSASESDTVGLAGGGWATIFTPTGGQAEAFFYDATGTQVGLRTPSGSDGAIATLASGNVVMASTGPSGGIFFETATAGGDVVRLGSITSSTGESNSDVAGLAGGGFVVVDQEDLGSGGDHDIWVHMRDDEGATLANFRVDSTSADDEDASIVALADGGFVVAFDRHTGGNSAVFVRVYNADGTARSNLLSDTTGSHNLKPGLTATAAGGFALSYQDNVNGPERISTATFDAQGVPLTYVVNATTAGDSEAAITTLSNGFLVTSFTELFSGADTDILAEVADPSTGNFLTDPAAPPFIRATGDAESASSVSALDLAKFIATWTDATTGQVIQSVQQLVRTSVGDDSGNTIQGDDAVDIETGGAGSDTLIGAANHDELSAAGGDDVIDGGDGDDLLDPGTGTDVVSGGAGNDLILMAGNLDATDQIDGGSGFDLLELDGDYSFSFSPGTVTAIDQIDLAGGHSYDLTLDNGTIAAGGFMFVLANLGAANTLRLDGSHETDGAFHVYGGGGNDVLIGGKGSDGFTPHGGNDVVAAGIGNDNIEMEANLTALDRIDGGLGSDTVTLDGNYAAGVVFNATTMVNVEIVTLAAGHIYKLTTAEATVAAGKQMTIDASQLGAGVDSLTFNGSHETDGSFKVLGGASADVITGGAGSDNLSGGAGNDTFTITSGGNDTVNGGDDDDTVKAGATLTAADRIAGGTGNDVVILDGDYSAGLTLAATTLTDVETLTLTAGHSYKLTTSDGNLTGGQTLTINGSNLGSNVLTFNGAAEADGHYIVTSAAGADSLTGGGGADSLTGGDGNDAMILSAGGNDIAKGGNGNDGFLLGAKLNAADAIDGGADNDTATLDGDYSTGVTFHAATLTNVESLILTAGHTYNLKTANATVAAGQTMLVNALGLGAGNALVFNGAAETDGSFTIFGGAGDDVLTGGRGADQITAGGGHDILAYTQVAQSTSVTFDTINGFDFNSVDRFDLNVPVKAVDLTVTNGLLTTANFDANLAFAIGTATLPKHTAVLFTPTSGDYNGHLFLVVDANGAAGYQAGADYVFDLVNPGSGAVDASDFI